MNDAFRVTFEIPPELVKLADGIGRNLATKILPNALDAAAAIVKPALVAELPDGTESRKLQTPKSRKLWPKKLKAEVAIKRFRPKRNTVLRIIGVKVGAGHAVFDHGDKALRREGRVHILWGKKAAANSPRKQKYDIAKIVAVKVEPAVTAIVKKHLEHAVASGELLKK